MHIYIYIYIYIYIHTNHTTTSSNTNNNDNTDGDKHTNAINNDRPADAGAPGEVPAALRRRPAARSPPRAGIS